MSLTTWIDATVRNTCTMGTIEHRVTGKPGAQRSVVTWKSGSKVVLLGESSLLGRKRAVYEVLNNAATIAKVRGLEADAVKRAALEAVAAEDEEVAFLLPGYRTVIESDPYVAA